MLTTYQIEEVKSYFNEEQDEDRSIEDDGPDISMIFQLPTPTTAHGLIAALPQRSIVDRLISRYFKAPLPSRRKYCSNKSRRLSNFCIRPHTQTDFPETGQQLSNK